MLSVPGASSTVLEVSVPYSRSSLVELLGQVRPLVHSLGKAVYWMAAMP